MAAPDRCIMIVTYFFIEIKRLMDNFRNKVNPTAIKITLFFRMST
jgi:hypothetical protein